MCSELDKTGVISCYQDALITGFSGSEAARFAFTWDIEAVTSNGFRRHTKRSRGRVDLFSVLS